MKKPRLRSKPHQIIARGVAPSQHHRVGKDCAERAHLIIDPGHAMFGDAEGYELITARSTLFGAAQLQHRCTGRIRNLEPVNQVVAAIITERVEGHVMKRAMRY